MSDNENGGVEMIDRAIKSFVQHRVGGVIVMDEEGEIIYTDPRIILSERAKKKFKKRRPSLEEERCWELSDTESGKYYRVETAAVSEEGRTLQCHLFTDVSDYASLFKDISDYSKQISDISDFQKQILGKISQGYDACLPDLCELCQGTEAMLFMETGEPNHVRVSVFHRNMRSYVTDVSAEIDEMLSAKRFDLSGGSYCFLSETTDDRRYALFLRRDMNFNEEYFREASVYNVIRLFIENGVLREKIIYESEHDKLTDLYNKDRFILDRDTEFGHPKHLAVLYFDVNNLKKVNDSQGHEAGDRLIVTAAKSLKAVLSENVHGYRIGGDEFVLVGSDVTDGGVKDIRSAWEEALQTINRSEPEKITIACGVACGEDTYDVEGLLEEADREMYRNKAEMKKQRGLSATEQGDR